MSLFSKPSGGVRYHLDMLRGGPLPVGVLRPAWPPPGSSPTPRLHLLRAPRARLPLARLRPPPLCLRVLPLALALSLSPSGVGSAASPP